MAPIKIKFKKRVSLLLRGRGKDKKSTIRKGKKTSPVWNFFEAVLTDPNDVDNPRSKCNLCGDVFKCPGGSTTGMRGHLDRKHPGLLANSAMYNDTSATMNESEDSPSTSPAPQDTFIEEDMEEFDEDEVSSAIVDHNEVSETIAAMCAIDLRPIQSVETLGFNSLLGCFDVPYIKRAIRPDPNFTSPTVALSTLYKREIDGAMKDIESPTRVNLSVEIWNHTKVHSYILLTVAYVNSEGVYCKKLVRVQEVEPVAKSGFCDMDKDKVVKLVGFRIEELLNEIGLDQRNSMFLIYQTGAYGKPVMGRESEDLILLPCFTQVIQQCFAEFQKKAKEILRYDIIRDASVIAKEYLSNWKVLKRNPYALLLAMKNNKKELAEKVAEIPMLKWELLDGYLSLLSPINEIIEFVTEKPNILLGNVLPLIFKMTKVLKNLDPTPQVVEITVPLNEGEKDEENEYAVLQLIGALLAPFETAYKVNLDHGMISTSLLSIASFVHPRFRDLSIADVEDRQVVITKVEQMVQALKKNPSETNFKALFEKCDGIPTGWDLNEENEQFPPLVSVDAKRKRGRPTLFQIQHHRRLLERQEKEEGEVALWLAPPTIPNELGRNIWAEWPFGQKVDQAGFSNLIKLAQVFMTAPAVAAFHTMPFSPDLEERHAKLASIEPELLEKILVLHDAYDKSMGQIKFAKSFF